MSTIAAPFISADYERAAEATGVSVTTIKEAVAAGDLVAHYAGRKSSKPLLRAADLDTWVEGMTTTKGGDI